MAEIAKRETFEKLDQTMVGLFCWSCHPFLLCIFAILHQLFQKPCKFVKDCYKMKIHNHKNVCIRLDDLSLIPLHAAS